MSRRQTRWWTVSQPGHCRCISLFTPGMRSRITAFLVQLFISVFSIDIKTIWEQRICMSGHVTFCAPDSDSMCVCSHELTPLCSNRALVFTAARCFRGPAPVQPVCFLCGVSVRLSDGSGLSVCLSVIINGPHRQTVLWESVATDDRSVCISHRQPHLQCFRSGVLRGTYQDVEICRINSVSTAQP